jgi:hypothetical protein
MLKIGMTRKGSQVQVLYGPPFRSSALVSRQVEGFQASSMLCNLT